ncbi:MAG: hypothetical protein WBA05_09125 [Gordonia sp. (in: high G+C Gram-positive bacteria)]|uniref:hypothetical protein n=1 Tax=Gordonia TaxID=2053 RepID=UPI003266F665
MLLRDKVTLTHPATGDRTVRADVQPVKMNEPVVVQKEGVLVGTEWVRDYRVIVAPSVSFNGVTEIRWNGEGHEVVAAPLTHSAGGRPHHQEVIMRSKTW